MTAVLLIGALLSVFSPAASAPAAIDTGQLPLRLTDFAFLPGGAIISTGRGGAVKLATPTGAMRDLVRIPVDDSGDIGLIGIEPAADFESSGAVYTTYTRRAGDVVVGRLSRWTVDDVTSPTRLQGEEVVLDGIPTDHPFHAIGTVVTAPDGSLFVGVGDGGTPAEASRLSLRAQDPSSPNGKILRIAIDGSGVPGNPFYDPRRPSSWASRVYALGLRNPFRFALRPGTTELWAGDVGWNAWEEIDVVDPGDNFGWPCWEGPERAADFRDLPECRSLYESMSPEAPFRAYRHPPGSASVTGGVFSGESSVAAGRYVFGDFVQGRILALDPEASDRVVTLDSLSFADGVGQPVRFRLGPGGEIYYADILSGKVLRLERPVAGAGPGRIVLALGGLLLLLGVAAAGSRR